MTDIYHYVASCLLAIRVGAAVHWHQGVDKLQNFWQELDWLNRIKRKKGRE